MATKVNDTVYTTREAAQYLKLAEDTVRRYIYRGLISATKHGPVYIVTREECDRYKKEKRPQGRPINKAPTQSR